MEMHFKLNNEDKEASFHAPQYDDNGWLCLYKLTFASPDLNMSISVENPPYGTSPAEFFQDLLNHWTGWQGEKTWAAMEGEFTIKASMSKTGHALICFSASIYYSPAEWVATACFDIEAGQLERIAKQANIFFKGRL